MSRSRKNVMRVSAMPGQAGPSGRSGAVPRLRACTASMSNGADWRGTPRPRSTERLRLRPT
eukprot:3475895-Heterocapsa_arctica.AAC.1